MFAVKSLLVLLALFYYGFSLNLYELSNQQTLSKYYTAIESGLITNALSYMNDGIVYQIHSVPRLVPTDSTYVGKSQLVTYFQNQPQYINVTSIVIYGLTFAAIQNDTILVTYTEQAQVTSSGKTYKSPVTAIFTFDATSLISYIDIYEDSALIADTFCPMNQALACVSSNMLDNLIDTYHFTTPNANMTNYTTYERMNYQTLLNYLMSLGAENIPAAVNQTSTDVVYTMHAYPKVVPVAGGSYVGHQGATNFFLDTGADFTSFTFQNPVIRALQNNTALATFLEVSTTKNSHSYQQVNAIIYVFDSMSKILSVDIWFNSIIVGEAIQCKNGQILQCQKTSGFMLEMLNSHLIMGLVLFVYGMMWN